jgi:sterol desaturase/sphingolipid hydroxylase (fatty acid hydroxylase superfamily)
VIPFVSGPSYHDHHHSNNVGNFSGSCYLWDVLLDTNQEYMDDFLKS